MSLDFLVSGTAGTGLVFALALLAVLVGFILWIPPRAARARAPEPLGADRAQAPTPSTNPIAALYFSSQGRIGRSIYWLAQIPLIAVNLLLMMIGDSTEASGAGSAFAFLIWVVVMVASIMVGIKRCHDRDKSGWWMLVSVIPFVGWLWTIVELGCLQGSAGENRFGPDPLAV